MILSSMSLHVLGLCTKFLLPAFMTLEKEGQHAVQAQKGQPYGMRLSICCSRLDVNT